VADASATPLAVVDEVHRAAIAVQPRVPMAREAIWSFLAAMAAVAAEIGLLRGSVLFTRPLWLDEIHTVLIAGAPSMREGMGRLAAGVDFNLPASYLLYRLAGGLTGELSELTLRVVSAGCVVGALVAVYVLLRTERGRVAAAVGALAVWAQPVVVNAAFDLPGGPLSHSRWRRSSRVRFIISGFCR
jgi:hypothetical protein